jgi:tripartite-type tricarboxylate transporter receptor subunit TctC
MNMSQAVSKMLKDSGLKFMFGTPAPVVEKLNKEINALLASDEVKNLFLKEGAEVDYLGPAEFGPFIAREIAKWGKVVKEANIKWE